MVSVCVYVSGGVSDGGRCWGVFVSGFVWWRLV